MVLIRPFEAKDNATILDMEKLCPQGDENYAMGADKSPDAAARYDLYNNSHFLVAEEEGRVIGSVGWALKNSLNYDYIYLTEVNVHPDFRKQGIASQLVEEVEKYAHKKGADHIYCYIFKPNKVSKTLFAKLGYSNILDMQSCVLTVYKEAKIPETYKIEKLKKSDIPEVVKIINNYYEAREHFLPYSSDSFAEFINSIPFYGLDNYWVAKDGDKIVAGAGLWDSSKFAKVCFTKEPLSWKILQRIFGFMAIFTKMPSLPAENEYFKLHMTMDQAYTNGNPDAVIALFKYFNNKLLETNEKFFLVNLDPKDNILQELKELSPQIDIWSVYNKSLDTKFNKNNQIYIDARDMIL